MSLNMLTLLLLAGAVGDTPGADGVIYPREPDPELPPRKPSDPARETEMLRDVVAPAADDPDHVYATRIRLARHQARDIDAYLDGHASARAEELRRHRRALLDFADECDAHRLFRSTFSPPAATPPTLLPARRQPDKPAALAVRCPRKSCTAKPGKRCHGRSGEAMDACHPERVRLAKK